MTEGVMLPQDARQAGGCQQGGQGKDHIPGDKKVCRYYRYVFVTAICTCSALSRRPPFSHDDIKACRLTTSCLIINPCLWNLPRSIADGHLPWSVPSGIDADCLISHRVGDSIWHTLNVVLGCLLLFSEDLSKECKAGNITWKFRVSSQVSRCSS